MSYNWDVYEPHMHKTWPFGKNDNLSSSNGFIVIRWAIDANMRYISKNGQLFWENPFWNSTTLFDLRNGVIIYARGGK